MNEIIDLLGELISLTKQELTIQLYRDGSGCIKCDNKEVQESTFESLDHCIRVLRNKISKVKPTTYEVKLYGEITITYVVTYNPDYLNYNIWRTINKNDQSFVGVTEHRNIHRVIEEHLNMIVSAISASAHDFLKGFKYP